MMIKIELFADCLIIHDYNNEILRDFIENSGYFFVLKRVKDCLVVKGSRVDLYDFLYKLSCRVDFLVV